MTLMDLQDNLMALSGPMDSENALVGDTREHVKRRLARLPVDCGYASDAAFAQQLLGISPQRWNAAKMTGALSNAMQTLLVQKIPGMTYEYLKSGRGPAYLARKDTTPSSRSRRS